MLFRSTLGASVMAVAVDRQEGSGGLTEGGRERERGKLSGRTMEIQRLIGRSLRSCIDLDKLGERTVTIDCDVIQADGGTRTASITGGYIALAMAVEKLIRAGKLKENPLISNVAAISVGVVSGIPMTDLKYSEDSAAEVDMNVIMNEKGEFIEMMVKQM